MLLYKAKFSSQSELNKDCILTFLKATIRIKTRKVSSNKFKILKFSAAAF